jgi:hypothetical protein
MNLMGRENKWIIVTDFCFCAATRRMVAGGSWRNGSVSTVVQPRTKRTLEMLGDMFEWAMHTERG